MLQLTIRLEESIFHAVPANRWEQSGILPNAGGYQELPLRPVHPSMYVRKGREVGTLY